MARVHYLQQPPGEPARLPFRLHPLTAAAAVSVIAVSVLGIGILSGIVPDLRATARGTAHASAPTTAPARAAPMTTAAVSQPTARVPDAVVVPAAASKTVGSGPQPATGATATIHAPVPPALALAPGETLVPPQALTAPAVVPLTPPAPSTAVPDVRTEESTAHRSARTADAGSGPHALRHSHARAEKHAAPSRTRAVEPSLFSGGMASGTVGSGAGTEATRTARLDADTDLKPNARRYSPQATVVSTNDARFAAAEVRPDNAPRITPVIRPPIPLDAPPAAGEPSPQRWRDADTLADDAGRGRTGQGARIGSDIGRSLGSTVGEGIDRTLSALAEVLGGRRERAAPVQDYPFDRSRGRDAGSGASTDLGEASYGNTAANR